MDEFLRRIAAAMQMAGMGASFDGLYLRVAGCAFSGENAKLDKEGNLVIAKFLGSRFKVDKDGSFDVARAVGLVMGALPTKMKEEQALREVKELAASMKDEAAGQDQGASSFKSGFYTRVAEQVYYSNSKEGLHVLFICDTAMQARLAIEALKRL